MNWTSLHSQLLARAFLSLLEKSPKKGTVAFCRCLDPIIVEILGKAKDVFVLPHWNSYRVIDAFDSPARSITADKAVEIREEKKEVAFFLVDLQRAGAGMDGIYSSAKEVEEKALFEQAHKLALAEIKKNLKISARNQAADAVKKAKGGRLHNVSDWAVFDYYVQIAEQKRHPGALLWQIGLWPVLESEKIDDKKFKSLLDLARQFRERLLGSSAATKTPQQKMEMLPFLTPVKDASKLSPVEQEEND